jgi:type II secretory pathway pseudopilin PulG
MGFHFIKSERGDTIVEVLISLLVISAILVGAFVLSHNSSRNVRDAQEHAEALELLQGQVELLRTAASSGGTLSLLPEFCMDSQATQVTYDPTACMSSNLGVSYADFYVLKIETGTTDDGGTAMTDDDTTTFTLTVDWNKIGGGTNHESLIYRVHVAS